MNASLLIIGDEILSGNVQDTNSSFAARLLFQNNIPVENILAVADTKNAIIEGIKYLFDTSDLIITTGGLGPTKDDVTKLAIAEYFNTPLAFDETVFKNLEERFTLRGRPLNSLDRDQAMVPASAEVIQNAVGTAPVFWMEKDDKVLVTLPGVPAEMRYLLENALLDRIKARFSGTQIVQSTIHVIGISESDLAIKLSDAETRIEAESNDSEHYKLAYLPDMGTIRLHITGTGEDRKQIETRVEDFKKEILEKAGKYVFGFDDESIGSYIGKILKEKHTTVSTAESCTGGYLAHLITSISGSSDYYIGSVISYANEVKIKDLGVNPSTLREFGAVSEQTCTEMLEGCLNKFGTTYAIATTGIAGPGGDETGKPVGMVWIGVGDKSRKMIRKYQFNRNRQENIHLFAISALDMLRKFILGIE